MRDGAAEVDKTQAHSSSPPVIMGKKGPSRMQEPRRAHKNIDGITVQHHLVATHVVANTVGAPLDAEVDTTSTSTQNGKQPCEVASPTNQLVR